MASVKKVKLTVEVTLTQWSPRDTISDDEIRRNVKSGIQELFSWGDTQNAGLRLGEYQCEVTTIESAEE
jgi:hypothetical protein